MLIQARGVLRNSLFCMAVCYSPSLYSQDTDIGLGIGLRKLTNIEESVKGYIESRDYTDQISGLENSINLDGRRFPYLFLRSGWIPRQNLPLGELELAAEFDWTSSFFAEETDKDKIPLYYSGINLGEADGEWGYTINGYGSLTLGLKYTPQVWQKGNTTLRLSIAPQGGLSYLDADINLNLSLKNNKVYMLMDPSYVEEEYGITELTTLEAHIFGLGYFFHPLLVASLQYRKFELEFQTGYRFETIDLTVDEILTSAEKTKSQGKGKADFSGDTFAASISYHF